MCLCVSVCVCVCEYLHHDVGSKEAARVKHPENVVDEQAQQTWITIGIGSSVQSSSVQFASVHFSSKRAPSSEYTQIPSESVRLTDMQLIKLLAINYQLSAIRHAINKTACHQLSTINYQTHMIGISLKFISVHFVSFRLRQHTKIPSEWVRITGVR